MIEGIVGLPGEGKTAYASKRMHEAIDLGEPVYSNVHVNDDRSWFYYEDFYLLKDVQRAFIVLDEAQVYMNSRKWKDFPPEFQAFLQQHRHQGVDMLALTQNLNRVDVTFRELVQELWQVEKHFIWSTGLLFGRFRMYQLAEPPTGYEPTGDTNAFWMWRSDFEYFDTHARAPRVLAPKLGICPICRREHMLVGWGEPVETDDPVETAAPPSVKH